MDNSKVKVVEIKGNGEVIISYRKMTPEEIKMGQFFKKFLEPKTSPQQSAIVKSNSEELQREIDSRCPCFAKPLNECDCEV